MQTRTMARPANQTWSRRTEDERPAQTTVDREIGRRRGKGRGSEMDPTLPPLRSMTAMLSLTASRAIGRPRQRHLTIAALPRPTTALFLDDSRQCPERLVDFSRRRNAAATSGSRTTTALPIAYCAAYLLVIPRLKSYSGRISSASGGSPVLAPGTVMKPPFQCRPEKSRKSWLAGIEDCGVQEGIGVPLPTVAAQFDLAVLWSGGVHVSMMRFPKQWQHYSMTGP